VIQHSARPKRLAAGFSPQVGEMVANTPIAMVSAKNPNKKIAIFAIRPPEQ